MIDNLRDYSGAMRKHTLKLLYFLFVAFFIVNIVQHRVVLLRRIYFREISANIYVSKRMPINYNVNVINIVNKAIQRNNQFFQSKTNSIDCFILFDSTDTRLFSRIETFASFKASLWMSWIVVTSDGLNTDIIAHEIGHHNVYQRLGTLRYFKHKYNLPIWIDEGLALQVDLRTDFEDRELLSKNQDISSLMKLLYRRNNSFYNDSDSYENYILSKYAVSTLLKTHSPDYIIKNYDVLCP
jgi:hypothetical protein